MRLRHVAAATALPLALAGCTTAKAQDLGLATSSSTDGATERVHPGHAGPLSGVVGGAANVPSVRLPCPDKPEGPEARLRWAS